MAIKFDSYVGAQQVRVQLLESVKLAEWDAYVRAFTPIERRVRGKRYEQAADEYEREYDYLVRLMDACAA